MIYNSYSSIPDGIWVDEVSSRSYSARTRHSISRGAVTDPSVTAICLSLGLHNLAESDRIQFERPPRMAPCTPDLYLTQLRRAALFDMLAKLLAVHTLFHIADEL